MTDCIILAGGQSLRLKFETQAPKPLLSIEDKTLLGYQIEWVSKYFDHIVIATTEDIYNGFLEKDEKIIRDKIVDFSIEWKKLGTSGAVLRACDYLSANKFYLFNVDDFLFNYNPLELYNQLERGGIIALSKPRIGFGLVTMKNHLITRFQEKPYLKAWVSCGHYCFKRDIVRDYFLEEGDMEREVLPILAKDKLLQGYKIHDTWYTVNDFKDYLSLLEYLKSKAKT